VLRGASVEDTRNHRFLARKGIVPVNQVSVQKNVRVVVVMEVRMFIWRGMDLPIALGVGRMYLEELLGYIDGVQYNFCLEQKKWLH
jgi:hypothetical protein